MNYWKSIIEFSLTRKGRALTHVYFFIVPSTIVSVFACMYITTMDGRKLDPYFLPRTFLQTFGTYLLFTVLPGHRPLPKELPDLKDVGWLVAAFLLSELIYYVIHRIEHENDFLYDNVHSVHHSHDDEQEQWIAEWGLVGSPLELFTTQIWIDLPYMLMVHPALTWIFLPWSMTSGLLEHNSGYTQSHKLFPFTTSQDHLKHHHFHYEGEAVNFGARLQIFDWLLGTYKS